MNKQEYCAYLQEKTPNSPIMKNCLRAFLTGGGICCIGEGIGDLLKIWLHAEEVRLWVPICMVFIGAFLTAIGVYDKLDTDSNTNAELIFERAEVYLLGLESYEKGKEILARAIEKEFWDTERLYKLATAPDFLYRDEISAYLKEENLFFHPEKDRLAAIRAVEKRKAAAEEAKRKAEEEAAKAAEDAETGESSSESESSGESDMQPSPSEGVDGGVSGGTGDASAQNGGVPSDSESLPGTEGTSAGSEPAAS